MQIDDCLSIRDGRLHVEGCDAGEQAARFGTPLYVVSEDQLRRRARAFVAAFGAAWPHGPVRVLPSIKANYALALRAVLTSEGLGCDVFGHGELEAALRAGTPPALISLNGSSKDSALIERAVGAGVRITADSLSELGLASAAAQRLGRPARVRVRVRPDLAGAEQPSDLFADPVSVREAIARYKPGIPTPALLATAGLPAALPGVELTGVMMHIGRHSADPGLWAAAIASLAGVVAALRDVWDGWEPAEIDVGGGFPLPRDPTGRTLARRADAPAPPPLERYQDAGASNFNALPRPGTVLVTGDAAELVRRPETVDDVFRRDVVPARLGGKGVTGLDHVSVACADVDRSLAFYRDLLGLELRDRGVGSAGAVGEITGTADAEVEWADLALPDGRVLELLRLPGGPPQPGSGHFALGLVEAEAVHRRLRAAGVPLRSEPVTIDDEGDWQGARCFYAKDPDGTVVELIERRGARS